MALCSKADTANSRETYAGSKVTKSYAVSNFISADRIQMNRIGLRWNWIKSRSNLVASANAPLVNFNLNFMIPNVLKAILSNELSSTLMLAPLILCISLLGYNK